ncbi:MAG TPA: hypothetical protein VGC99_19445 [Candidatus Tectomicrobia bacterium]
MAQRQIGVVTSYLFQLIAKQVEDHRLVVWYDPEGAYTAAAAAFELPNTTVARYDGSFFQLRHDIDSLLNDVQLPRLVVYVPEDRGKTGPCSHRVGSGWRGYPAGSTTPYPEHPTGHCRTQRSEIDPG